MTVCVYSWLHIGHSSCTLEGIVNMHLLGQGLGFGWSVRVSVVYADPQTHRSLNDICIPPGVALVGQFYNHLFL